MHSHLPHPFYTTESGKRTTDTYFIPYILFT